MHSELLFFRACCIPLPCCQVEDVAEHTTASDTLACILYHESIHLWVWISRTSGEAAEVYGELSMPACFPATQNLGLHALAAISGRMLNLCVFVSALPAWLSPALDEVLSRGAQANWPGLERESIHAKSPWALVPRNGDGVAAWLPVTDLGAVLRTYTP